MSGPYDYRTARPDLSSSSPLHGLQAAFTSSPPLSPGSPTPAFRRGVLAGSRSKSAAQLGQLQDGNEVLDEDGDDVSTIGDITARRGTLHSPSSSNPHPFSGSAKATLQSHPSFGKGQLRSKHLRNSPKQPPPPLGQGGAGWVLKASSSGISALAARKGTDSILAQHFHDSSDDYPSSDDPTSVFSSRETISHSSQSSVQALRNARMGLGIEDMDDDEGRHDPSKKASGLLQVPFSEESSASILAPPKPRVRKLSRFQSSSQDPFSAGAGSSVFSPNPSTSMQVLSPRANRASQRRRLTGSSPRQLTRAESGQFTTEGESGFFDGINESDEDDSWDNDVQHSPRASAKSRSAAPTFDWRKPIDSAFERADGALRLNDCGITQMDPTIADLAKFVHVPRHRADGPRTGMSRVSSLANAGERLASGPSSLSNPPSPTATRNAPSSQGTMSGSGSSSNLSSNVELYLARNSLRVLPSALFDVTNIVVLSIRQNGIRELPPAIGQLVNLRELNIAQNELTSLPAEIQRLRLDGFYHFPNPFQSPPEDARLSLRLPFGAMQASTSAIAEADDKPPTSQTGSMLPPPVPNRSRSHQLITGQTGFAASGALQIEEDGARLTPGVSRASDAMWRYLEAYNGKAASTRLPTLTEICVRRLLCEPAAADIDEQDTYDLSGAKMLLEGHEADMLSKSGLPLNGKIVAALEAARRSALGGWGRTRPPSMSPWYAGLHTVSPASKRRQRAIRVLSDERRHETADNALPSTPPRAMDDALGAHFAEADGEASGELTSDSDDDFSAVPERRVKVDIEHILDEGDDSIQNPWFNRCPNPEHGASKTQPSSSVGDLPAVARDWPHAPSIAHGGTHVYSRPCVERLEWVSHVAGMKVGNVSAKDAQAQDADGKTVGPPAYGSGCLPIRWRGCSPRCLDFLEQL